MNTRLHHVFLILALFAGLHQTAAQITAFTYQGQLNSNGAPANGSYDVAFTLYATNVTGTALAGPVMNTAVAVSNGLFTTTVDFGNVFTGASNWLEIAVSTNGANAFSTLAPRQLLTPVPMALFANSASNVLGSVNASQLTGSIPAAQLPAEVVTNNGASVNLAGTFTGNGAGMTNVNAATLGGISSAGFWRTDGNAGANPTNGAFLGTTDYLPLELRVNGARALRLEPTTDSTEVNVIGGSVGNQVINGAYGATVWGGGFDGTNNNGNTVAGNFGTVSGGRQNSANNAEATVAGGRANTADGSNSTVSGGYANTVSGAYGSIGGGIFNVLTSADDATIGGGYQNTIQPGSTYATINGGGYNNILSNSPSTTIGGGVVNTVGAQEGTVAGGAFNSALAFSSTIGGGGGNAASGGWSTISGGRDNVLTNADYATIGGGVANLIQTNASNAMIGGGHNNTIESAAHSTIGGGGYNTIQFNAYDSVIGGGGFNTIQPNAHSSFIGGGGGNTIQTNSDSSVIGGGNQNTILNYSSYATIGGGYQNTIQTNAYASFIGGGLQNTIQTNGYYSTIGGGVGNSIQNYAIGSTIGGGFLNVVQGGNEDSTIGGGQQNTIQTGAAYSTIAGGSANTIQYNAGYATIGGGYQNTIQSNAFAAIIPGGWFNSAGANFAFAAGRRAKANHTGAFVWADSTDADFASTAANQYLIRAGGGVGINKNNPATALDVAGTVTATSFSGSGASLTGLNAANLSGTITDARLSANVALLNTSQTFTGLNLFNNAANSFSGTFTGSGSSLTALNASQLTSGAVPAAALGNAWQIGGNGSTTSGTHFLGTTDNQALELKVNNLRALRLEPNLNAPNIIAGNPANVVSNGFYGSVIMGGGSAATPNRVGATYASVLGGNGNTASAHYSVAMGLNTTASGLYSTAMGRGTVAANDDATAMGLGCSASGWDTVAMGTYSVAGGHYSLAAGYYSQATNQSAFVWSDSSATPGANSLVANSVTMRASGGYRLFSNAGMSSGVSLAANGTAWAVISDRNAKKDFAPVDSREILEKLAAMPITQWHYKWEEAGVTPHIGPMAQDFKGAFYPGTDDKSITTQEADGVAFAAIQGLNQKLEAKNAEIESLKQSVAELKQLVQTLVERK